MAAGESDGESKRSYQPPPSSPGGEAARSREKPRARSSRSRDHATGRATLPQVVAQGKRLSFHEDLYHFTLRLSWTAFAALATLAFVGTNIVFALLYMLVPGSILNASSFVD